MYWSAFSVEEFVWWYGITLADNADGADFRVADKGVIIEHKGAMGSYGQLAESTFFAEGFVRCCGIALADNADGADFRVRTRG